MTRHVVGRRAGDGGPRGSRYLCLIRRKVTEFAGKV
ncbi:hypothetical protein SVIOM74S_06214 [Streptomyces violarus]